MERIWDSGGDVEEGDWSVTGCEEERTGFV